MPYVYDKTTSVQPIWSDQYGLTNYVEIVAIKLEISREILEMNIV